VLAGQTIPAPEFLHGLMFLSGHNYAGHTSYALGQVSQFGFWYAYPLAFAVKTPWPFLLLLLAAAVTPWLRPGRPRHWSHLGVLLLVALALLVMLPSRINIGLRHVFILYPLVAIAAAHTLSSVWLRQDEAKRHLAVLMISGLFFWQGVELWRSSADWLAYFNPFAGSDVAHVLSDSDLDWGQGVYRLEQFFANKQADALTIQYNGSAQLCAYSLPPLKGLDPRQPPKGWVAISERFFRVALSQHNAGEPLVLPLRTTLCDGASPATRQTLDRQAHKWLATAIPVGFAGRSIRIYYFPQDSRRRVSGGRSAPTSSHDTNTPIHTDVTRDGTLRQNSSPK
jgi:hypothetical protein